MPKAQVTSVTVAHIFDDESTEDYKIGVWRRDDETVISVRDSSGMVWFRPESWPEVREQINGFMDDLAADKAGGDAP